MGEHADDAGYRIFGTFEHGTALSYFEKAKLDALVKSPKTVIPAKAGIQKHLNSLDSVSSTE
jgi:hypothetical protein